MHGPAGELRENDVALREQIAVRHKPGKRSKSRTGGAERRGACNLRAGGSELL